MKVLVVGGTGLIGGDIALLLQQAGHEVTLMARRPVAAPGLAALPFMRGDYVNDEMADGRLAGFDSLVFSATADIRNLPRDGSVTPEDFYRQANDEAVPRFFERARAAGLQRAVLIGSFYPQVAPQRVGVCPYVTSRYNTDRSVRALSGDDFRVCSLNAPFVLGRIPGLRVPHIDAMVAYARGEIPGAGVFAPRGGSNHISSRSLAQAALHALERGESGKDYLVGDQNYTWKEYLELWFAAVGRPQELEVRDEEHPLFPDVIMFAGPGATVRYEPAAEDMAVLAYDRQQIPDTVREIVAATPAAT
jgi:dihydroflavonol-4-reductase